MKVIVIGATGTIGAQVTAQLTAHRHEVIAASRHGKVKTDIDDRHSIQALFDQVQDVDAVVCCAGNAAFKPLSELSDADFELGLRSKLMGQVSLARVAIQHLRDHGSITLTAGVLATRPMPGSASISLVNAGIEGFARAAALELPRGLRINAVSPPWVSETLVKYGMQAEVQLPAARVAKAYVALVEGTQQGAVIDPGKM